MTGLETSRDIKPANENALSLAGQAFLHSALQEPYDGISQLVNHVAGHTVLKERQIASAPLPAEFGSLGWTAETIGSGLGMVVPFLAAEAVTRGAAAGVGSLADRVGLADGLASSVGLTSDGVAEAGSLAQAVKFAAPAAKMAADGAVFGLAFTPSSSDSQKSFWQQRGESALSSALTFGAMGLTSSAMMNGLGMSEAGVVNAAAQSSLKGIGARLAVNAVSGSVGGLVSAESNSLLQTHSLASASDVGQSMASFLVTGGAMDAMHLGAEQIASGFRGSSAPANEARDAVAETSNGANTDASTGANTDTARIGNDIAADGKQIAGAANADATATTHENEVPAENLTASDNAKSAADALAEVTAFGQHLTPDQSAMLDKIQQAHFEYFRQESDPVTGLTKDRSTDTSPASIAATGFSLTAYPVGVNHGWVSRDEAADYTLKVLRNLSSTPQGEAAEGTSGVNGLFYHFMDPHTGLRAGQNEVSTIDTALLMGGVLFSKDYFDQDAPKETEIRNLADQLYKRVDWNWLMQKDGRLSMGWTPENGVIPAEWEGLNEGPILMMLGMGSPTHPLPDDAWSKYMSTAQVGEHNGQKDIDFGPMFGHQYPQIWLDFRNIEDATNKKLGFNYFENSRRATLAQHQYAESNPQQWSGYSNLDWGLTASDGPGDQTKVVDGKPRQFFGYNARGFPNAPDDGTIAPTAAGGSLPFAPEVVLPTLQHWMTDRPELVSSIGFKDAFNPTFDTTKPSGWVDTDTLGIDQGPILLMAENYGNASIWNVMHKDPYLNTALNKAGFTPENPQPEQTSMTGSQSQK